MITGQTVKQFFEQPSVVEHYSRATNCVGLWASEERVFRKFLKPTDSILELGCGAGRIAIGLYEIGFRFLMATDLAESMVEEGRRICEVLDYGIAFRQADATALPFEEASFEAVLFGFNGLMQIPSRKNRFKALQEAFRVLVPGGRFIFTTHDRDNPKNRAYWEEERQRWLKGIQDDRLIEFGDLYWETPEGGFMFIHSPARDEVLSDLKAAGFIHEQDMMRSSISLESESTRSFSDECRFWIVKKPLAS